jgi:hypothetical protein
VSGTLVSTHARLTERLPGWLPAAVLLIATAVAGPSLGGMSRIAFVLGCGAAGWYAWHRGPGVHLQTALVLFAFAPFVRRLVDLSVGYDQTGIMLVGPLLALLPPVVRLLALLDRNGPLHRQIAPLLVVGACVVYATALSLFQGDWMNAASGALKWSVPLLYAAVLVDMDEPDELMRAAASAFLVILPVTGLYGLFQYVNPPDWDRYWMSFAPIMSAGQPLPYEVRTFSTMNGPASFATFTAAGLLLVLFLRSTWIPLLLTSPAALALLLSQYRTAWLSLLVGVLFCLLLAQTRRRAVFILAALLGAAVIAVTLTPFADVIGDRLATLGEGSQDGSARERIEEFVTLWKQPDSALFGSGFTVTDVGSAGAMPVDGMIIACWVAMGIVVGLVCLSGFIWAAVNAIREAWRGRSAEAIVVGALGCGALVQMPLANISSGELGFLFWTFAALASFAPLRTPPGVS